MIADLHKAVEDNSIPNKPSLARNWSVHMTDFMRNIRTAAPQGTDFLRTAVAEYLQSRPADVRAPILNGAVAELINVRNFDIAALIFDLALSQYGHVFPAHTTTRMLAISHAVTATGYTELLVLLEEFFRPTLRKLSDGGGSKRKPHPGFTNVVLPALNQGSLADLLDLMDEIDYPVSLLEEVALLYYDLNPGIAPSGRMAAKMINFAGRGGDLDAAVGWLTRAQSAPSERSTYSESSVQIRGRRKASSSTDVHLTSKDVAQVAGDAFADAREVLPRQGALARPYAVIINTFFRKNKVSPESLKDLLRHMAQAGVTPDTETFNALIGLYSERGDYEPAMKLYDALVASSGITRQAVKGKTQGNGETSRSPTLPVMFPNAQTFSIMHNLVHLVIAQKRQSPPYAINPQPPASCAPRVLFRHMMLAHGMWLSANPTFATLPTSPIKSPVASLDTLNVALRALLTTRDYAGAIVCLRSFPYFSRPQELTPTLATLRAVMNHILYRTRSWRSRINALSSAKRHARVHATTWEGEMLGHNLARKRRVDLTQVAKAVLKVAEARGEDESWVDDDEVASVELPHTISASGEVQPGNKLQEGESNWRVVHSMDWPSARWNRVRYPRPDTTQALSLPSTASPSSRSPPYLPEWATLPFRQIHSILCHSLLRSVELDYPLVEGDKVGPPSDAQASQLCALAINTAKKEMVPDEARYEFDARWKRQRQQDAPQQGPQEDAMETDQDGAAPEGAQTDLGDVSLSSHDKGAKLCELEGPSSGSPQYGEGVSSETTDRVNP